MDKRVVRVVVDTHRVTIGDSSYWVNELITELTSDIPEGFADAVIFRGLFSAKRRYKTQEQAADAGWALIKESSDRYSDESTVLAFEQKIREVSGRFSNRSRTYPLFTDPYPPKG